MPRPRLFPCFDLRRVLPLRALTTATLVACAAGGALAQPPSVASPAAVQAVTAFEACLAREAAATAVPTACRAQEAALVSAVRKENPDRPLFALSYAETVRSQARLDASPPVAVSLVTPGAAATR